MKELNPPDQGNPRKSERELRTIIETIPAYVWTAAPDGAVDFSTESWFDGRAYGGGRAIGWTWTENVHRDDRETSSLHGVKPSPPAIHSTTNCGCATRKEEYRWILVRAVPLREDSGAIVRWYGTITDIDDRKRAEDELRELKDQLHKENIALRDESQPGLDVRGDRRHLGAAAAGAGAGERRWRAPTRPCSSPARPAPGRS